jgi:hypothetical protein
VFTSVLNFPSIRSLPPPNFRFTQLDMQFTLGIGIIVALTLPYQRALADPNEPIQLLKINNECKYDGTDQMVKFHFNVEFKNLRWTWSDVGHIL